MSSKTGFFVLWVRENFSQNKFVTSRGRQINLEFDTPKACFLEQAAPILFVRQSWFFLFFSKLNLCKSSIWTGYLFDGPHFSPIPHQTIIQAVCSLFTGLTMVQLIQGLLQQCGQNIWNKEGSCVNVVKQIFSLGLLYWYKQSLNSEWEHRHHPTLGICPCTQPNSETGVTLCEKTNVWLDFHPQTCFLVSQNENYIG